MNRKYAYVEAQKSIYRFEYDDFAKPVELKTEYQNAKLEISRNGTVAAAQCGRGRLKSRPLLSFRFSGGLGDFHRGFVFEGSPRSL